jgi:hypothetical protein
MHLIGFHYKKKKSNEIKEPKSHPWDRPKSTKLIISKLLYKGKIVMHFTKCCKTSTAYGMEAIYYCYYLNL